MQTYNRDSLYYSAFIRCYKMSLKKHKRYFGNTYAHTLLFVQKQS